MTQGRYTWRHDKVLSEIAEALEQERKKKNTKRQGLTFINFLKPGQTRQHKDQEAVGLMKSGTWNMRADLNQKLVFPQEIVTTQLRPYIVLWSEDTRQVALVELTVPWEERVEISHHLKREKYAELQAECVEKGWKTWVFPVEVGCRGFPAQSLWNMFRTLGVTGKLRSTAVAKAGDAAKKASCWLWMRREQRTWLP